MKKSEKALKEKASASRRVAGMLHRVPVWVLTAVALLVIGWLTLAPQPVGDLEPPLFEGADKLAHACLFGMLTLCLIFDVMRAMRLPRVSLLLAAGSAAASTLAGIGIEYAQKYMELGRSFEPTDMIADLVGSVAAAASALLFRRLSRRHGNHKPS